MKKQEWKIQAELQDRFDQLNRNHPLPQITSSNPFDYLNNNDRVFSLAFECNNWFRSYGVNEGQRGITANSLKLCVDAFNSIDAPEAAQAITRVDSPYSGKTSRYVLQSIYLYSAGAKPSKTATTTSRDEPKH